MCISVSYLIYYTSHSFLSFSLQIIPNLNNNQSTLHNLTHIHSSIEPFLVPALSTPSSNAPSIHPSILPPLLLLLQVRSPVPPPPKSQSQFAYTGEKSLPVMTCLIPRYFLPTQVRTVFVLYSTLHCCTGISHIHPQATRLVEMRRARPASKERRMSELQEIFFPRGKKKKEPTFPYQLPNPHPMNPFRIPL